MRRTLGLPGATKEAGSLCSAAWMLILFHFSDSSAVLQRMWWEFPVIYSCSFFLCLPFHPAVTPVKHDGSDEYHSNYTSYYSRKREGTREDHKNEMQMCQYFPRKANLVLWGFPKVFSFSGQIVEESYTGWEQNPISVWEISCDKKWELSECDCLTPLHQPCCLLPWKASPSFGEDYFHSKQPLCKDLRHMGLLLAASPVLSSLRCWNSCLFLQLRPLRCK